MYDNYPPGAANDPRAPYNEPLSDDVDYKVVAELFNDDDTSETREFNVTIRVYPGLRYSEEDIGQLIRDELDSGSLKNVDYDVLDYDLQ